MLLGTGFVVAAELDDAAVFVEAFDAYQKKDYLLSIEKAGQLNQAFPDSPLRDVTLLLIARSGIKSGDNELAAKSVLKFRSEFPDSGLTNTIEEELLVLAARHQKGEPLQPNIQLQSAARKIRDDRLAQERAALQKLEQERLAKEKSERERLAKEKAEAVRREQERLVAEKAAKAAIKAVISLRDSGNLVPAGQNGSMPVDISNRGKNSEQFLLEVTGGAEYGAFLSSAGKPDAVVTAIRLASGETFKGKLNFRMPADKFDGHRVVLTVKCVSAKFSDVMQVKNALAIASAP
ncbi:MAG: hypothetical protein HY888_00690, partial [Deltaproteobacteria bacterium]|nr:hypothetical protein [Deltaproteobacteria bacterium]